MVQILNKMVHLKYPISEIWCCHKHINQLPPSRLKFDTKLRIVFPNNLATQLCTSHSRRENIAPNFVCLFQPIKCKHVKLRFCYLWHLLLFSNAFFKAQMWQKAEGYIPKQVCQHSTAQVIAIVTGKIFRVLHESFECLFWPIKCMHSKPRFWVPFSALQVRDPISVTRKSKKKVS